MKKLCAIYRSTRVAEMYLYVDKKQGLSQVPAPLIEHFGTPVHVMDMPLLPNAPPAIWKEASLRLMAGPAFPAPWRAGHCRPARSRA